MQLTPEQKHIFEQLGRNPDFRVWLAGEEAQANKVLKANQNAWQLAQAQGAVQLIERIQVHCGLNK